MFCFLLIVYTFASCCLIVIENNTLTTLEISTNKLSKDCLEKYMHRQDR